LIDWSELHIVICLSTFVNISKSTSIHPEINNITSHRIWSVHYIEIFFKNCKRSWGEHSSSTCESTSVDTIGHIYLGTNSRVKSCQICVLYDIVDRIAQHSTPIFLSSSVNACTLYELVRERWGRDLVVLVDNSEEIVRCSEGDCMVVNCVDLTAILYSMSDASSSSRYNRLAHCCEENKLVEILFNPFGQLSGGQLDYRKSYMSCKICWTSYEESTQLKSDLTVDEYSCLETSNQDIWATMSSIHEWGMRSIKIGIQIAWYLLTVMRWELLSGICTIYTRKPLIDLISSISKVRSPSSLSQKLNLNRNIIHKRSCKIIRRSKLEPQMCILINFFRKWIWNQGKIDRFSNILREIDLSWDNCIVLFVGLELESIASDDVCDCYADLVDAYCTLGCYCYGDLAVLEVTG